MHYITYGDERLEQKCYLSFIWRKCNLHVTVFTLNVCMCYKVVVSRNLTLEDPSDLVSIIFPDGDILIICCLSESSWVSILLAWFIAKFFRSRFYILTLCHNLAKWPSHYLYFFSFSFGLTTLKKCGKVSCHKCHIVTVTWMGCHNIMSYNQVIWEVWENSAQTM